MDTDGIRTIKGLNLSIKSQSDLNFIETRRFSKYCLFINTTNNEKRWDRWNS